MGSFVVSAEVCWNILTLVYMRPIGKANMPKRLLCGMATMYKARSASIVRKKCPTERDHIPHCKNSAEDASLDRCTYKPVYYRVSLPKISAGSVKAGHHDA